MLEGVPLAVGGVAAAHVLNDDDISSRRSFEAKSNSTALVVGRALQQHRELAVHVRPVDIGAQNDAIAHLDGQATFCNYIVGLCGLQKRHGQDQAESSRAHSGCPIEHGAPPTFKDTFKEKIRYQFL